MAIPTSSPFVGRAHHLAALADAFAASRWRAVTMLAHGTSGMGTSALLRVFLDGLVQTHQALVLRARSFIADTAPYKAITTLLAPGSLSLPPSGPWGLSPSDVSALARLFPAWLGAPALPAPTGPSSFVR